MDRAAFFRLVDMELDRAIKKRGRGNWTRHELHNVLNWQLSEVWEAIRTNAPEKQLVDEVVRIAAVCLHYATKFYAVVGSPALEAGPSKVNEPNRGRETDYILLYGFSPAELAEMVDASLTKGWKLVGGVSEVLLSDGRTRLTQAVVKGPTV